MLAIADWAQRLPQDLLKRLGCRRRNDDSIDRIPPSEPTIRRTLEAIDADELDRVLHAFLLRHGLGRAIAFDGKTLRGSGNGAERPRHLMVAVIHQTGVVVGQQAVDTKTNEITVARPLLESLDLVGRVVTTDAMHTQSALAEYVVDEKHADYVLTVKDNQRILKRHLTPLDWDFSPQAQTIQKGHGRIEQRRTPRRAMFSDRTRNHRPAWPVAATGVRLWCHELFTGRSLAPRPLAFVQGHWGIENKVHWVRDVVFDEDRSQIRTGNGPRAMATLRNLAVSLLRLHGHPNLARATRQYNAHRDQALQMIGA